MSNLLGRFVAAFRFLTIMPLPGALGTTEQELAGATLFFPLVGLVLGLLALPVVWCLQQIFPPSVIAVLAVTLLAAFSGGLHLDGLADTADGFFSARPRERILEIMHDSASGVMGVVALVLILLLKVACLASLSTFLLPVIFLMPLAGRTAIVLMMALLPYARPAGGLALIFYTRRSLLVALWGLICFLVAAWLAAGEQGAGAVLAVVILVLLFARFCYLKIGGATGDTLGASSELAETVVALVFTLGLRGMG